MAHTWRISEATRQAFMFLSVQCIWLVRRSMLAAVTVPNSVTKSTGANETHHVCTLSNGWL